MPRPGLLQRLQRRPERTARPGLLEWSEVLALALVRLLAARHGARTRPGMSAAALTIHDLGDDAALRRLCDDLVRGVTCQEPRLTRVRAGVVARDDTGLVRLRIDAQTAASEPAACAIRLRPLLPPEVHRAL